MGWCRCFQEGVSNLSRTWLPHSLALRCLPQSHALERIHWWKRRHLPTLFLAFRFNASDIAVKSRIDNPVDPRILNDLIKKFAEFRKAYEEGGMKIEEFVSFGATRRTLRQFIVACHDLDAVVRDFMLPNPDAA